MVGTKTTVFVISHKPINVKSLAKGKGPNKTDIELENLTYKFDYKGNIAKINDTLVVYGSDQQAVTGKLSQDFTYDDLGRLTQQMDFSA